MTLAQLPVGKEGVIEGDPIQINLRGYDITIRKEDGEKIILKEESVQ